jgi:hypothetical protein
VRLNFVFFTDSVSELCGQRMYDQGGKVKVKVKVTLEQTRKAQRGVKV